MKKLLVVFLGVLCVLSACNKGPNPKDSLIAAGKAIQNCDADNIDRYVDLSSVINGAIDVVARHDIKELPKDKIMGLTAMKVIIVPVIKEYILKGVKDFSNSDSEYKQYLKMIKVKEYKILDNKDGIASAKVVLNYDDAKKYLLEKNLLPEEAKQYMQNAETPTFIFKMKQSGDHWQITEISNLDEIIKKYAPLYEEKMKEAKKNKDSKGLKGALSLANTICFSQQRYFLVNNVYTNNFEDLDIDFVDDSGEPVNGSSFVSKGVNFSITNEGEIIMEGQNYTIKKECFSSMVTCQDEDDSICSEVMYNEDI